MEFQHRRCSQVGCLVRRHTSHFIFWGPRFISLALQPFPAEFRTQTIATNGATIHVRVGGKGPAVVLLHGYGETGDMWAPLAAELARDHTVIVPDLRGMGLSSRPPGGFDKKTQADDVAGVLDALKIDKADLVTHDIGNMVGFAFAAQHPERVTQVRADRRAGARRRAVGGDLARIRCSGISVSAGRTWSGSSRAASASISIASGTSSPPIRRTSARRPASTMRSSMPCPARCMRASRSSPPSIRTPSTTARSLAKGKLTMPVLAVGGEKSFGPTMATVMRAAATDVHEGIVPDSGHWIMEENPAATIKLVTDFLKK